MNGIDTRIKETPENSVHFLPCEDIVVCGPGRRPPVDTEPAGGSFSDCQALELGEINVCCVNHWYVVICYSNPN